MTQPEPRYPYVHIDVPGEQVELAALALWELGASGVEERDARTFTPPDAVGMTTLVASFADDEAALAAVAGLPSGYHARITHVVGDDWRDGWRAHFKPTRVGRRLVIRPSWEPFTPGPDDVVITLDPGGAFGTGTHESTRLSLELLEGAVTPAPVLDVGAGSGILSIAALRLGASRAVAIDVDPAAVVATGENAAANGVADRLSASGAPLGAIAERFPLVLANIEAHVLNPLAQTLLARVAPGGALILSGILVEQVDTVLAAYGAHAGAGTRAAASGVCCEARASAGDWVALRLRVGEDGG